MIPRFLIVGAGPSGLYTAKLLMRRFKNQAVIDLLEKDLIAGGLLRWGVAPDHPEVKNALKNFDDLLDNPNFHLFTNVKPALPFPQMKPYYSAIIQATGADGLKDMTLLGQNNANGPMVINAMDFVNFYNQHPFNDHQDEVTRLKSMTGIKKIAIIGNGNVSLDIARLLTKKTSELEKHQLPRAFYRFLERNPIEEITIIGRRGAVQAACSVKELRELISESTFVSKASPCEINLSSDSQSLEETDAKINIRRRTIKKRFEIFQNLAQKSNDTVFKLGTIKFQFLLAPFEVLHRDGKNLLRCHRTHLSGLPFQLKAESDKNQIEEIDADLVIKSLGFQNRKANTQTSILDESHHAYRCGWASTGGIGALADSYNDCDQTEQHIHEALLKESKLFESPSSFIASQIELLQNHVTDFPILGKHEYKQFRLREIAAGYEIKDMNVLKQCIA